VERRSDRSVLPEVAGLGPLPAAVSFVLDRYGHLFPESDAALRDRLDALFRAAMN
jgi:hypothetical protein